MIEYRKMVTFWMINGGVVVTIIGCQGHQELCMARWMYYIGLIQFSVYLKEETQRLMWYSRWLDVGFAGFEGLDEQGDIF